MLRMGPDISKGLGHRATLKYGDVIMACSWSDVGEFAGLSIVCEGICCECESLCCVCDCDASVSELLCCMHFVPRVCIHAELSCESGYVGDFVLSGEKCIGAVRDT